MHCVAWNSSLYSSTANESIHGVFSVRVNVRIDVEWEHIYSW